MNSLRMQRSARRASRSRRPHAVGFALAAALAVPASLAVSTPAWAATSCQAEVSVAGEWSGGFVANVTVRNTGDAVDGWTVTWEASGDQQVAGAWSADVTQSGSKLTARNVGYNASIGSGAAASFGFQINGSTNAAPTAFTFNGTACDGSDGPAPAPAPPPPTPPSDPPADDPAPPSAGPIVDARCTSEQFGQFTEGAFTMFNNIWGGGAGGQELCVSSLAQWRVVADHPNTGGIKSYPNASIDLNRKLSSMNSLTSSFDVSVPSSGAYETTYDLWADNNAYEIMVWMNQNGAVGPIAESYDANGAVPSETNVTVGGHTWNVFRGSNGANAVLSFVRTSNTNSGTVDLLALLNHLRASGSFGDVTLGQQQFGYEITSSSGGQTFTTNNYSLDFS